MEEEEFVKHILAGDNDLPYFVEHIFSKSFDNFVLGDHVVTTAKLLQNNKETIRVSARDHFKSLSLYSHIMWELMYNPGLEGHYFSYNDKMSSYHLGKVKQLIDRNPFFNQMIDLKPLAEGILKYTWDPKGRGRNITNIYPGGLLGFKRGVHAPRIYVDDPLRDPENKLNPTVINKINSIFKTEVISMLLENGHMHVVGTPQTDYDFFFDKEATHGMEVKILPAIKSWKTKEVLWPEFWSWERLMLRRRKLGDRIFNQEFLCKPVWTEHAWFSRDAIMDVVNPVLTQQKEMLKDQYVVLGWDLAKKVHPAHVTIFAEARPGIWVQVYQKFMDRWKYTRQLEHMVDLIDRFKVDEGAFDDTRGEMEGFDERGEIPNLLKGVNFKTKLKHDIAVNFERMVDNNQVELMDDRRMIEQILVVDNDLKALVTPDGHGDSFWSIALALSLAGNKSESFDAAIY